VGLDVSHHARISQRGGEKLFYLTSFFIGAKSRFFTNRDAGRCQLLVSPASISTDGQTRSRELVGCSFLVLDSSTIELDASKLPHKAANDD
jgi:hypothetical protein